MQKEFLGKHVIKTVKLFVGIVVVMGMVIGCGSKTDDKQKEETNNSSTIQETQTKDEEQVVNTEAESLNSLVERRFIKQPMTPYKIGSPTWVYGENVFEFLKHPHNYDNMINMDGSLAIIGGDSQYFQIKNGNIDYIDMNISNIIVATVGRKLTYQNELGEVILYDAQSRAANKIASAGIPIAISPDGNSVVYCKDSDYYVYSNNQVFEIGNDIRIVAISDSAKYIYYIKEQGDSNELYVITNISEHKKIADHAHGCYLNKDQTQLLFWANGSYYYVEGDGDKIDLGETEYWDFMLVPKHTWYQKLQFEKWNSELEIYTYFLYTKCGTDNLLNQFYYNESNGILYYVNEKGSIKKIEENLTDVKISQNGRSIYYLKNNELYYLMDTKLSNPTLVVANVSSFIIQSETEVYYKDLSNTFCYKKSNKEAMVIAENVYFEGITYNDNVIFITDFRNKSGNLYYSKNGSEKGLIAENVSHVRTYLGATYYYGNYYQETNSFGTFDKCNFYFVTEDMNSKLLVDGCSYSVAKEGIY